MRVMESSRCRVRHSGHFMSSVTRFREASKDHLLLELVALRLLDTTEQRSFDNHHLQIVSCCRIERICSTYMRHRDLLHREQVLLEVLVVKIDLGFANRLAGNRNDRHSRYDFHHRLLLHGQSLLPVEVSFESAIS
jgi:hypothetical protein